MSATQYQPGPTPVPRSRNTMAMVIGAVSFMMALGGIAAVLLTSAGGPSTTPPIDPPVNPPVVPTPTATPDPPVTPTPTPTPPPDQGTEDTLVDPNRICADDPLLPPPDVEDIEGTEFKIYDTSRPPNGVPDVAVAEDPQAGKIVIVDRGEKGNWDEAGTCQDGTYVQID